MLAHMREDGMEQKYVKEAFDTDWVVPNGVGSIREGDGGVLLV